MTGVALKLFRSTFPLLRCPRRAFARCRIFNEFFKKSRHQRQRQCGAWGVSMGWSPAVIKFDHSNWKRTEVITGELIKAQGLKNHQGHDLSLSASNVGVGKGSRCQGLTIMALGCAPQVPTMPTSFAPMDLLGFQPWFISLFVGDAWEGSEKMLSVCNNDKHKDGLWWSSWTKNQG